MSKLAITMACSPYDRFQPLMDGSVQVDGIDLNFIPMEVEETFWRQLRYGEFQVSELSFSSFVMQKSRGDERFIGIPVFSSRFFRHSCVYINAHKGIRTPQDLKGKLVGVPEYQMTAPLWLRGIFQHYYDVAPHEMHWRAGGLYEAAREEKLPISLPANIDYQPIPRDRTLSDMLESGELDALFTARMPASFMRGSTNVKRLFENYVEEEARFYQDTGIFPIMHVIGILRETYEQHPWVAMSLYKACLQAKKITQENLTNTSALYTMLPWQVHEVERTRQLMGDDWWPYGFKENHKVIEAICRYSFEQGLSKRLVEPEELFAKETFDMFKV